MLGDTKCSSALEISSKFEYCLIAKTPIIYLFVCLFFLFFCLFDLEYDCCFKGGLFKS